MSQYNNASLRFINSVLLKLENFNNLNCCFVGIILAQYFGRGQRSEIHPSARRKNEGFYHFILLSNHNNENNVFSIICYLRKTKPIKCI